MATDLRGSVIDLADHEFRLLHRACAGQTHERTHPDITIQTCWDADRLDLGRVGIVPHPSYLCTDAAKTDEKLHIQINEIPGGQSRFHQAVVVACRNGIGIFDWHKFELFDDDDALAAEADRLRPWLDRQQFRNPKRRAIFKKEHPELLLVTKKKRRGKG